MAPPAHRRSGINKKAQLGVFTGYVVAGFPRDGCRASSSGNVSELADRTTAPKHGIQVRHARVQPVDHAHPREAACRGRRLRLCANRRYVCRDLSLTKRQLGRRKKLGH